MNTVTKMVKNSGLTLSSKKGHSFLNAINYVWQVLAPRKSKVSSRTKDTIKDLRHSTNMTWLRSILGLRIVYMIFVPKFVRKMAPLNKLLKKEAPKNSASTWLSDWR